MNDPRPDMTTVPIFDLPRVGQIDMSTAANTATTTGAQPDLSTVVRETTILIGSDALGTPASSSAIHEALSRYGVVDDEVVRRLVRNADNKRPSVRRKRSSISLKKKDRSSGCGTAGSIVRWDFC